MRLDADHRSFERQVDPPRAGFDDAQIGLVRDEKVDLGKRNASALRETPHRIADHPHGVYDGENWSFWQYTSTGLVPGIAGRVDINVFAGSKQAWAGWLAARQM